MDTQNNSYIALFNETNVSASNINSSSISTDSITDLSGNGVNIENIVIENGLITDSAYTQGLLQSDASGLITSSSSIPFTISVDAINENTIDAGVTVDNTLIKDDVFYGACEQVLINIAPPASQYNLIFTDSISTTADLYNGGTLIYDTGNNTLTTGALQTNTIIESDALADVNIQGLKVKNDGTINDSGYTTGLLHSNSTGVITSSAVVDSDISGGVSQIIITGFATPNSSFFLPLVENYTLSNVYVGGLNFNTDFNRLYVAEIATTKIIEANVDDGVMIEDIILKDGLIQDSSYSTGILHSDTNGVITSSAVDLASADVSGILPNAKTTATNSNTVSAIVSRDASGNFSAGIITASLSGNSTTATTATNISTTGTSTNADFYLMFSDANYSQTSTKIYTPLNTYLKFNPSSSLFTCFSASITNNLNVNLLNCYSGSTITTTALNIIPEFTSGCSLGDNTHYFASVYVNVLYNSNRIFTDRLEENTTNNGVLIDGVLLKDGLLSDTAYTTGILKSNVNGVITSSEIVNADISASAGIVYSKLSLANSIVNADINTSAGIVDTKLATISTAGKISNSAMSAINKIGNNQSGNASNSVAFGDQALGASTNTTNLSVAIGPACQRDCTTGVANTAMGFAALLNNQTGSLNTAIGRGCLELTPTSITGNTCVGYNSGNSLSGTGSNNTLIGRDCGTNMNSVSGENTCVGYLSGTNITGSYNSCFGIASGRYLGGAGNVILGASCLPNANVGCAYNVVIGYNNCGTYVNSESNNIVIGNSVGVVANESNKVRIGNGSITNNYFNGDVSATSFTGSLTGTATNATNVNLTDTTTNASHFLTFSSTATGNQPLKTTGGIVCNPSSNNITASSFSGQLIGTLGTVTGNTQTQGDNSTKIATTAYVDRFWSSTITISMALFANPTIQGGNVNAIYYNYNVGTINSSTGSLTITLPTAGTYTFVGNMGRGSNYGIATLIINSVNNATTFQGYNATTTVGTWKITGISLNAGSNTIEIKCFSLTAPSSAYYITGESYIYFICTS